MSIEIHGQHNKRVCRVSIGYNDQEYGHRVPLFRIYILLMLCHALRVISHYNSSRSLNRTFPCCRLISRYNSSRSLNRTFPCCRLISRYNSSRSLNRTFPCCRTGLPRKISRLASISWWLICPSLLTSASTESEMILLTILYTIFPIK